MLMPETQNLKMDKKSHVQIFFVKLYAPATIARYSKITKNNLKQISP